MLANSLCPWEIQKEEIWVPHNADLCKFPLTQASSYRQVGQAEAQLAGMLQLKFLHQ